MSKIFQSNFKMETYIALIILLFNLISTQKEKIEDPLEKNIAKYQGIYRLVLVIPPNFEESESLKLYENHKAKQGYQIEKVTYTNLEETRQNLKNIYKKQQKPMAVLIIGDTNLIDYFYSKTDTGSLATDFYYGEYTDDYAQEAIVGRFPVNSEEELNTIVKKLIYMEEELPIGNEEVKTVLATSQDIQGLQMQQIVDDLKNKANIKLIYSSQIPNNIENGAGCMIYTGHGSTSSWYGFNNYAASNLENKVYPIAIGSTCLSGSYQSNCIGEELLRNKNGGAIGFIGASRTSFAAYNFVMMNGNDISSRFEYYPGAMNSLYYNDTIDIKYKANNLGEVLSACHKSLRTYSQTSNEGINKLGISSIEMYNLLGDPTYIPYINISKEIKIECDGKAYRDSNFVVNTGAPLAQVALSKLENGTIKLITSTIGDDYGKAVLIIPENAPLGEVILYSIAQNYPGRNKSITIEEKTGEKSSDTSLKNINVDGKSADKIIGSNSYKIDIEYEQYSVIINAVPTESKSIIKGNGKTSKLNFGRNSFEIEVIAENGNTEKYTLFIDRKESIKSKDASIYSLQIFAGGKEYPVAEYDYYYDLYLCKDETEIKINVTLSHLKATYEISDTTNIPREGDNIYKNYPNYHIISVDVTPEFGTEEKRSYTIRVYKNTDKCKECSINNCLLCSNTNYCDTCATGYYSSGTGCLQCKKENCRICSSNGACSKCNFGYENIAGDCKNCLVANCKKCTNDSPYTCSECLSDFDNINGQCIKCNIDKCKYCNLKGECEQCIDGYSIVDGKCSNCRTENCKVCNNINGLCEICNDGYYVSKDGECIQYEDDFKEAKNEEDITEENINSIEESESEFKSDNKEEEFNILNEEDSTESGNDENMSKIAILLLLLLL